MLTVDTGKKQLYTKCPLIIQGLSTKLCFILLGIWKSIIISEEIKNILRQFLRATETVKLQKMGYML